MESCQKIFLGPEMVTDSNDEQLEYFPQDGYDYDQHFVNDKNRIGFTSFIIEPDNIQAKWKDPVFTGVLEKPVAEMDEDELEIFELLQSDSKEEKENTINHQSDGDDAAEEFFKSILPKGKQLDNITRQALWGQPLWFEETPPMRIGALTAKNLKRIERDEIGSDLSYIASESEDPDTITKTDKLHIDEEEFQRALRGLSDGSSCDEGRVIWTKDTDESLVNMQHDNSYEAHQIHNLNLIAEDFVARESRRQEELTLNQIQPLDPRLKEKTIQLLEQQSTESSSSLDFDEEDHSPPESSSPIHFACESSPLHLPPPKKTNKARILKLSDLL